LLTPKDLVRRRAIRNHRADQAAADVLLQMIRRHVSSTRGRPPEASWQAVLWGIRHWVGTLYPAIDRDTLASLGVLTLVAADRARPTALRGAVRLVRDRATQGLLRVTASPARLRQARELLYTALEQGELEAAEQAREVLRPFFWDLVDKLTDTTWQA